MEEIIHKTCGKRIEDCDCKNPEVSIMEGIKGKAKKKPVEIEFWRNTGNENNALKMMDWIGEGNTVEFSCPEHEDHWDGTLIITTLEGDMRVDVGDYVIRGVNGEHYPCKPDIFHKTYEVL